MGVVRFQGRLGLFHLLSFCISAEGRERPAIITIRSVVSGVSIEPPSKKPILARAKNTGM